MKFAVLQCRQESVLEVKPSAGDKERVTARNWDVTSRYRDPEDSEHSN